MRGAALMDSLKGIRREPDGKRGVRVSRMGIEKKALGALSRRLGRRGINTPAVKEALVLASKVASAKGVLAELCISDDPDYTTGYVASRKTGYLRLPNIKRAGSRQGGRVFFIENGTDVDGIIAYLESEPVMITSVSEVSGGRGLFHVF
jgi:6-carboxyhexanoate--CoA ligase